MMTVMARSSGVDMAYAYKPLHFPGIAHAFLNTLLYLDYDRKEWRPNRDGGNINLEAVEFFQKLNTKF